MDSFAAALRALGPLARAFVGGSTEAAKEAGIPPELIEPEELLKPLDWHRATKTEHEVALIEAACVRAADGHRVAREAFEAGASEREIHWAYLQATDHLEKEMPFGTIVAFNEKAATLHYEHKRGRETGPGRTLIMDAGVQCDGYASDITRTWARPDVVPEYLAILEGVDAFQRQLVYQNLIPRIIEIFCVGRRWNWCHRAVDCILVLRERREVRI